MTTYLQHVMTTLGRKYGSRSVITPGKPVTATICYNLLGQGSIISAELEDRLSSAYQHYKIKMIPSDKQLVVTVYD